MKRILLITAIILSTLFSYAQELPSFKGKEIKGTLDEWDAHLKKSCTFYKNENGLKLYNTNFLEFPARVSLAYSPKTKQVSEIQLSIRPNAIKYFNQYDIENSYSKIYNLIQSKYGNPTKSEKADFKTPEGRLDFNRQKSHHSDFWSFGDTGYIELEIEEANYLSYRIRLTFGNRKAEQIRQKEMADIEL